MKKIMKVNKNKLNKVYNDSKDAINEMAEEDDFFS